MRKVRWGVLSTASIANEVVPAINQGQFGMVTAIASRELSKAQLAAASLAIPKIYGSYEELLADPDVDVIYNPLPNHLHIPWTIKAVEAGKHVLCEKPLSMTLAEAKLLRSICERHAVTVGEAFMFRCHPQWLRVRELIDNGRIGALCLMTGCFSYFNRDPGDIRNRLDCGGGALTDVGCYLINASRYAFSQEPEKVIAYMDRDPDLGIDRITSAILAFRNGQAILTCSTQAAAYQRIILFGSHGRIEIEMPFNAPQERSARILIGDESDFFGDGTSRETFVACNQHALQGEVFSRAILEDTPVPVSVEDSIKNATIMESIVRSASSGQWVVVQ